MHKKGEGLDAEDQQCSNTLQWTGLNKRHCRSCSVIDFSCLARMATLPTLCSPAAWVFCFNSGWESKGGKKKRWSQQKQNAAIKSSPWIPCQVCNRKGAHHRKGYCSSKTSSSPVFLLPGFIPEQFVPPDPSNQTTGLSMRNWGAQVLVMPNWFYLSGPQ